MNLGTLAGFLQLGLELYAAHASGDKKKIRNTGKTIRKLATELDLLYYEEEGEPLDWSKITKHDHLE